MALTTANLLDQLFADHELGDGSAPREFLRAFGPPPAGAELEDAFERLLRVALRADRRSAGGLAGHQAAIRRLFPNTPADAVCAFCISEDRGPHPKYIDTSLTPDGSDFRMTGTKRWGSVAPDADLLYVAASVGRDGDRNDLRMVALPADRPGITLDLAPYADYGTEHRIADIEFDTVMVRADEVLEAEAYESYIKPFRLIEDVYNSAGVHIALLRLGRDHGWADEQLETLVGLICQAHAVSSTDMSSPASILLLTSYLRASGDLWNAAWAAWPDAPPDIVAQWQPGRGLLDVAARARETRRQNAWAALRAAGS